MVCLAEVLVRQLPAKDTDTSFFGYVIADEALAEWQTVGRAEAKAEKEKRKRKREKEAAGKVKERKKMGLSEG